MKDLNENSQKGHSAPSFWTTMKSRKVLASAGILILAGGIFLASHQYVEANMVPFYRVYLNGQEIGTVQDNDQLDEAFKERLAQLEQQYPAAKIVLQKDGISTSLEKSYKAQIDSESTLAKLEDQIPYHAEGVAVKIDGKVVGVVKDKAAAAEVLERVKSKYAPSIAVQSTASKVKKLSATVSTTAKTAAPASTTAGNGSGVESASFVEKVEEVPYTGDASKFISVDALASELLQDKEKSVNYVVQEGDTVSSIAQKLGTTQQTIFQLNPGLSELKMQIGTKLNIKQAEAPLTVKTVEKESEQVTIEPTVVYRTNSKLAAGKTVVASPGAHGSKVMSYKVVKENGQTVSREWLGQSVTKPSSPKIVVKGTLQVKQTTTAKKTSSSSSSFMFAWPVSSPTITSPYGMRWGELHKGVDVVSSNSTIRAAADGKVTFTGTKTGYGNCIVIKHSNGYETLYGHLSKISVKEGQTVSQGDKIGVMGSTGHSTGTHLHFEIHKNGEVQNPTKYLS